MPDVQNDILSSKSSSSTGKFRCFLWGNHTGAVNNAQNFDICQNKIPERLVPRGGSGFKMQSYPIQGQNLLTPQTPRGFPNNFPATAQSYTSHITVECSSKGGWSSLREEITLLFTTSPCASALFKQLHILSLHTSGTAPWHRQSVTKTALNTDWSARQKPKSPPPCLPKPGGSLLRDEEPAAAGGACSLTFLLKRAWCLYQTQGGNKPLKPLWRTREREILSLPVLLLLLGRENYFYPGRRSMILYLRLHIWGVPGHSKAQDWFTKPKNFKNQGFRTRILLKYFETYHRLKKLVLS